MADAFNTLDATPVFTDPVLEASVASIDADFDVALSTRAADRTTAGAPFSVRLSDGSAFYDGTKTGQLPAALSGGRLDVVVGAALPTGTNTLGSVKITDGTFTASVRDTGSSDSLNVAIVDASGNQITSFSGGTQYAEDTASAPGDLLTMAGVVRKDTAATLVDTDGDRTQLEVDANGRLWVNGSSVTQPISAASLPLPTGAATEATLSTVATNTGTTATNTGAISTNLGAAADAAASSDTGTFSLISLFKRALQHLTDITLSGTNTTATILASASRAVTTTSATQTNLYAQGAHFIIDVTANTGAISIAPTIQAQDSVSSKWYDVLAGKNITSIGTNVIKIHPGLPSTTNVAAADGLPLTWRCVITSNNGNAVTYSVGVNYLE